jgi:hypothetical protein
MGIHRIRTDLIGSCLKIFYHRIHRKEAAKISRKKYNGHDKKHYGVYYYRRISFDMILCKIVQIQTQRDHCKEHYGQYPFVPFSFKHKCLPSGF